MTREQVRATVLRLLGDIAPEADFDTLDPELPIREQLDIDSMDYLNFIIALHTELQVEVPEADYAKLSTLNACIDYLNRHLS